MGLMRLSSPSHLLSTRLSTLLALLAVPATRATGCYTGPPDHQCLCDLTNSTCVGHFAPGSWSDRCCLALPPPSPPISPPPCHADQGCYDHENTHTCDCKITKSQCTAGAGTWTTGCGCDHEGDPGYEPCNTSTANYGCYNANGHHQCDCESSQSACSAAGGMWIDGCSCTAEASPPPAPRPPPLPMKGGRVVVDLRAECPAVTYLATYVHTGLLDTMASLTGVASDFISISVGDHCDTPSGARGAAFASLTLDVSCATSEHVKILRGQLADSFTDAQSASFLLGIAVIDQPVVTDVCNGCGGGVTHREVLAAVLGALSAILVVGGAAFVGSRAYRRRGQGLLSGRSTDPLASASPYLSSTQ